AGSPARSGDDLPEMPCQGRLQALRERPRPGRRLAEVSRRSANPGPAFDGLWTYRAALPAEPRLELPGACRGNAPFGPGDLFANGRAKIRRSARQGAGCRAEGKEGAAVVLSHPGALGSPRPPPRSPLRHSRST